MASEHILRCDFLIKPEFLESGKYSSMKLLACVCCYGGVLYPLIFLTFFNIRYDTTITFFVWSYYILSCICICSLEKILKQKINK